MESHKAAVTAGQADSRHGASCSGGQVSRKGVDCERENFPPGSLITGNADIPRAFPIELEMDEFRVVIHRK